MSFYRHDPERDVHLVDCGGLVDLHTGIERLRALKRELDRRPARDSVFKILIDFQNTVWTDDSVHRELSRITRSEFGLNADNQAIRAAIVNTRYSGAIADNERWFFAPEPALRWLADPAEPVSTRTPSST